MTDRRTAVAQELHRQARTFTSWDRLPEGIRMMLLCEAGKILEVADKAEGRSAPPKFEPVDKGPA